MLLCNLSMLLAERKTKITKVSNDTGLSRTTLTALYYNKAKGIQFETLNTLCNYFKITPSELFEYIPIEVNFVNIYLYGLPPTNKYRLDCKIEYKQTKKDISFCCFLTDYKGYKSFHIGLFKNQDDVELDNDSYALATFQKIPYDFKQTISVDIVQLLLSKDIIEQSDISTITLVWDDELDEYIEPKTLSVGRGLTAIFGNGIEEFLKQRYPENKDPNE